jgi:outer membrane protein TolC
MMTERHGLESCARRAARSLVTLALLPAAAAAQPVRTITLEEALERAEVHSEEVAIARAGVTRAEGEQVRARSEWLPQLSGSASYDRALASEFSGLFDAAPQPGCGPLVLDPSRPLAERVAELERGVDCGLIGGFGRSDADPLPFGRENTWRLGLTVSQNVFSGGRIEAQRAMAQESRRSAEIGLSSVRAQLLLDVIRAYHDAALAERLVGIAEATYRQAEATFQQTKLAREAGTQPEFELLRAQVARDTQQPVVIRQRAARDLAHLRLKQLLELPLQEDIRLVVDLDAASLPPPAAIAEALAAAIEGIRTEERAPIRQAAALVGVREEALTIARSQRLPNISLTSSYGRVAYPAGLVPDDFRTNWSVGATLQVPIFTGGRIRGDEMVARAELEETRARLKHTQELAMLDTRTAFEELEASRASWEASAGTVQQAVRAYEIAELRYREGISTQLELSDARLLLAQAQVNRAQNARDLQVARTRVALLPYLPLDATGATTPNLMPSTDPQAAGAATALRAQGTTRLPAGQTAQTGVRQP